MHAGDDLTRGSAQRCAYSDTYRNSQSDAARCRTSASQSQWILPNGELPRDARTAEVIGPLQRGPETHQAAEVRQDAESPEEPQAHQDAEAAEDTETRKDESAETDQDAETQEDEEPEAIGDKNTQTNENPQAAEITETDQDAETQEDQETKTDEDATSPCSTDANEWTVGDSGPVGFAGGAGWSWP